jgi:hypothetical protein
VLLFAIQNAITTRSVPDCMPAIRSLGPGMSMNRY